jgi:hypothetical protein
MQACISSSPPSLIRCVSSGTRLGQRVPAFPAIHSSLEGFCLPTLPYIGVPNSADRRSKFSLNDLDVFSLSEEIDPSTNERSKEFWEFAKNVKKGNGYSMVIVNAVNYRHERTHYLISRTQFGQRIRMANSLLHGAILTLFAGNPITFWGTVTRPDDPIVVPLEAKESGTVLERGWREVFYANEYLLPWEEAIAVHCSLDQARNFGQISAKEQTKLEKAIKDTYGPQIKGFRHAFDVSKNYLKTYGTQGIDQVVEDLAEKVFSGSWNQYFESWNESIEPFAQLENWYKYFYSFPDEPLLCTFNEDGIDFLPAEKVLLIGMKLPFELLRPYGSVPFIDDLTLAFWIVLESISEQLTQGVGVKCPFWYGNNCCISRPLWEWLLNHTVLKKGSPGPWRPEGCLKL